MYEHVDGPKLYEVPPLEQRLLERGADVPAYPDHLAELFTNQVALEPPAEAVFPPESETVPAPPPSVELMAELPDEPPQASLEILWEDLKYNALDPLTEILGRGAFLLQVERRLKMKSRHDDPPSHTLAVFDVDHFKRINDAENGGHPVGDAVLVAIAQTLKTSVRANDIVARLGGDEFGVLMQTPPEEGKAFADRLRSGIGKLALDEWREPVTVSIGMAGIALGDETFEKVWEKAYGRADTALYVAKNTRDNAAYYISDGSGVATFYPSNEERTGPSRLRQVIDVLFPNWTNNTRNSR